jgi:hypothetical protein
MEDNPNPKTIKQATKLQDWPQLKVAINFKLDSLIQKKVLGPITTVAQDIHLTEYTWMFVKKRNVVGKVVTYKACLVARGFT